MPLYEYGCRACGAVFSRLRPLSAAGESAPCPRCGAAAGRTLAAFAVHRGKEAPAQVAPPPAAGPQLCQQYPHIPLLCHMEPQAAARWIARAEGREEQYLEREAQKREAASRAGLPPPPAPAADAGHHFGHMHAHTAVHPAEAGNAKGGRD